MHKQKIVCIIAVRMGSSRLPGKVMLDIVGKPVLGHLIERVSRAKFIDELVVATSNDPQNDKIDNYCKAIKVPCFRGSEEDVLGRLYEALKFSRADTGVEIFGDGPLADPEIIDSIVKFYSDHVNEYDFVSNDLKTTYPPGTEVEVYSLNVLNDAAKRATEPVIREHGSLYIRQNPQFYRLYNIEAPAELYYPDISIELDTEEDFRVIKAVYENLYPVNPNFNTFDVINFLKSHLEIRSINRNVQRRWKDLRKE